MATSPSATPTPITPPRVPIIDPRTGLIDRAWYQFFLSLFRASTTALDDQNFGPPVQDLSGDFSNLYDQAQLASMSNSLVESLQTQIDGVRQEVQTLPKPPTMSGRLRLRSSAASLPWLIQRTRVLEAHLCSLEEQRQAALQAMALRFTTSPESPPKIH